MQHNATTEKSNAITPARTMVSFVLFASNTIKLAIALFCPGAAGSGKLCRIRE